MDSNYIYIYILLVFSIGKLTSSKDIEKNQRNDSEDVKYLAFVTNGDLYSCPCVIISERHLLASGSCIRRHERGLEIIAGVVPHTYDANDIDNDDERAVRKISKIKYHDQYVNQVRSMRIHNSFVVLTLIDSLPIGDNIKIAKLPTKDVEINDEATIHGWYQTCTIRSPPRFINAPLTVVDSSNCSRIDKDEFCASSEMTEKIIHSSPVIVNGTIIGYTTFGCPSLNNDHTVTSVYYYLSFIKNAMKPFI